MRAILALVVTLACVSGPPARHQMPSTQSVDPNVRVFETTGDPHMTEGDTMLDVAPSVAFAEVANYQQWPKIFKDIYSVNITKLAGDDARVTFVGPDDHHDNLHFHNRSAANTIWFEDTGGSSTVWAEIAFIPGDQPNTTHVHSRLYADVGGVAGFFVSDNKVREMREQRVYDDLFDLHAHFAHSH
jgi:hypothetical protein